MSITNPVQHKRVSIDTSVLAEWAERIAYVQELGEIIGGVVKTARVGLGPTLTSAAEASGVNVNRLTKIEKGEIVPTLEEVAKLNRYLTVLAEDGLPTTIDDHIAEAEIDPEL